MTKQARYDVEWVAVEELKPKSFQNTNRLTPKKRARLKRSIEQDGLIPPLLVRRETNEVIDGEHRWEIAKDDLGWDEVPVVRMSMTDAEARIIARRRVMARGEEEIEFVDAWMKEIADLGALDDAQMGLLLSDNEIERWDEIEVELLEEEDPPLQEEPPVVETESHPTAGGWDEEDEEEEEEEPEELEDGPEPSKKRAPKLHRVNVLFQGEDAELVKRVLGKAPGYRIVEICSYWEKHDLDSKLLEEEEQEDDQEIAA